MESSAEGEGKPPGGALYLSECDM